MLLQFIMNNDLKHAKKHCLQELVSFEAIYTCCRYKSVVHIMMGPFTKDIQAANIAPLIFFLYLDSAL